MSKKTQKRKRNMKKEDIKKVKDSELNDSDLDFDGLTGYNEEKQKGFYDRFYTTKEMVELLDIKKESTFTNYAMKHGFSFSKKGWDMHSILDDLGVENKRVVKGKEAIRIIGIKHPGDTLKRAFDLGRMNVYYYYEDVLNKRREIADKRKREAVQMHVASEAKKKKELEKKRSEERRLQVELEAKKKKELYRKCDSCGKSAPPSKRITLTHDGVELNFCSKGCQLDAQSKIQLDHIQSVEEQMKIIEDVSDESRVEYKIYLKRQYHSKLRKYAADRNITLSDIIERSLHVWFEFDRLK